MRYIRMREAILAPSYTQEPDQYDLDPNTFFVSLVQNGDFIACGRVVCKRSPEFDLPLTGKFKIDLGQILPRVDFSKTSMAELGAVVTKPEYTGFSLSSRLQAETFRHFTQGGFGVDIFSGLLRTRVTPVTFRLLQKLHIHTAFLEGDMIKGPSGQLTLAVMSKEPMPQLWPAPEGVTISGSENFNVQRFLREKRGLREGAR